MFRTMAAITVRAVVQNIGLGRRFDGCRRPARVTNGGLGHELSEMLSVNLRAYCPLIDFVCRVLIRASKYI